MAQKKMKNLLTGGLFTDEISSEGVIFHRQTGNPGKKKDTPLLGVSCEKRKQRRWRLMGNDNRAVRQKFCPVAKCFPVVFEGRSV